MDFDKPKVYGDTSITDGLVIIIYRLEEPQRKRIRLLKASHGSDSDSSSASSQEGTGDRSRAKLGNWFTGKHTIQVQYMVLIVFY